MILNLIKNKSNAVDILLDTPSKYYYENVNEYLSPTTYPSWLKDIKKKTQRESFEMSLELFHRMGTVKQCPAFIDIVKNSLTLFSPADLTIEIKKDSKEWRFFTPWNKMKVVQHDLINQMGPTNPITKNGIHLKIETPFLIKSSKPITMYFMQPLYHEFHPFIVIPGGIDLNSKYPLQLNLNLMISNSEIENEKNETKLIKIKKGDVLAYMHYGKSFSVNNIVVNLMDINEEFYPERLCEVSNFQKLSNNDY
jgi:hypothetical protein